MDKNILCIVVVETYKHFSRNQYISPKRFLNYEFLNSNKFFLLLKINYLKLLRMLMNRFEL